MTPRRRAPTRPARSTGVGLRDLTAGLRYRVSSFKRRRAEEQLLPQLALQLGRSVRNGRPLELALLDASSTGHRGVERAHREVAAGRSVADALSDWIDRCDSDAEHLLVSALWLGNDLGGNVARSLDIVGDGIRDDLQLAARRRTLLTQSRLSALVLVSLPIVFAAMASLVQGRLIYQGWTGLMLLIVGGMLDVLGMLWIRRLLRSLQ